MSRTIPLPFQVGHIDALIARLRSLRYEYARLGAAPDPRVLKELREQSACVMLQAPTGIGKTLIAAEVLARFSAEEPLLWFWFAPFAGLVDQAASVLKQQAPTLTQLDVIAHRQIDRLEPGSTFVLTWQTVAARSSASRLARQATETGLSIDDLIVAAREQGLRVGVVVDEAHHGFVRAQEACRFFADVLAPDYVLMMTATPRDADAPRFEAMTRYKLGNPDEWASIPRSEGVSAQLLKRSVKAARFIAKSEDEAQLLSFEEVALSECAAMHRRLQKLMRDAGLGATPLMLVQVPNGGDALKRAREHLVGALRFDPQAVRVHTADEPDPNLRAMANDPKVEVILFKMAIATGFDAPRAATLAALRGTRDVNFGIQVVGRILRVHREMQGKLHQLPAELSFGYVFLANSEAQEGLLGAAAELNQMPGHLIGSMASSVVTIYADQVLVQRVGLGESLELVPDADLPHVLSVDEVAEAHRASQRLSIPTGAQPVPGGNPPAGGILGGTGHVPSVGDLFPDLPATPTDTPLARVLSLESRRGPREYRKRPGTPDELVTEVLPDLPDDFEAQLVAYIDFSRVLGDRLRVRSQLTARTTDVFAGGVSEDREIWARVSPAAIATRASQLAFEFDGLDRRTMRQALKARFRAALQAAGHEVPGDDEDLSQQLDLVLVRNPALVRDAYKRARLEHARQQTVRLAPVLTSDVDLEPAARNVYGVFPPDLTTPEREFAQTVDTAADVLWWHRNPVRSPQSVAIYTWANGAGFFPDFIVGVDGRHEGDGTALTEIKGPQLLYYDRLKAGAVHPRYGRVFMIGRDSQSGPLRLWRLRGDALVDDGIFEPLRLRYS